MLINANGIDIFYEQLGEGPPVLLIHGNGEDHHIFDDMAVELAKTHTVYLPDTRGHGGSSPVERLAYEDMADDIAAFTEKLDIKQPLLIGFSDGGISGMLVELRHPGTLSKLVLCGANTQPDGLLWYCKAGMQLLNIFKRDDKIRLMLEQPDIKEEELRRISIPVYVLAGSKDIISRGHTQHIADSIPGSSLRILEGHSHMSYIQNYKVLLAAIDGFM